MKTIYLARHAKSSWESDALTDFDRPLNERGASDAMLVGHAMHGMEWKPERIFSSTALRAKRTCEAYCQTLRFPHDEVEWNKKLYASYTRFILGLLSEQDENTKSVMIIGHNPELEKVLIDLCGHKAVNNYLQPEGKILTTANVAKLSTEIPWADLKTATGKDKQVEIETILRPKDI